MRPLKVRYVLMVVVLVVTCDSNAAGEDSDGSGPVVNVAGYFHYGSADGFLQTPAGGQPGSSSHHRPTLDEVGIDDAVFYDMLASVQWHSLNLYAGYQGIPLEAQAVLSQDLISRSVTFPAGTRVQSKCDLNWLRAGAGWQFLFLDRRVELLPKAEFAVLDFNYQLSGGGQAVQRSYPKGALRIGLESRYRLNRVISLNLNAEGSVPISNTPQIAALTGGIAFDLLPGNRRFHPTFFLGGGAQRIEYEDNQELPNHFRVNLGPFVTTGLAISF